MIDYHDLKPDCRKFRPDRPCAPHKRRGAVCPTCDEYEPATRRVLLIKLASLGDVLRTTSLLPAIRTKFPDAHLTWLTERDACGLFVNNALVDEVWTSDGSATAARLASVEFDTVLCPDADPVAAAFAAAARCGERFGFTLDSRGRVMPIGQAAEHWFRMGISDPLKRANRETYQVLVARALGLDPAEIVEPVLDPTPEDRAAATGMRTEFRFDGPLVGLNTGTGERWEYKQWTFEHQCAFVQRASEAGAGVVLLGGPDERERHAALVEACSGATLFESGTENSYGRFAAIVEQCDVVVTGDTFAMHVATARHVPAVVLFGPTSAAEIELFGRGTKLLPEDLDCLGCYLPRCDVRPHCQARIMPDRVWSAVSEHLAARQGGR